MIMSTDILWKVTFVSRYLIFFVYMSYRQIWNLQAWRLKVLLTIYLVVLYPICKEGNELWDTYDTTGEYIIEPKFSKCSVFSSFVDVIFPMR